MKVFSVRHEGIWLDGKSVAIATNKSEAMKLVQAKLRDIGLGHDMESIDIEEINVDVPGVYVLDDGDY